MTKTCLDVRLNVKPIFIMFNHKYYYEGPCRMSGGETLVPDFDLGVNANIVKGISKALAAHSPEDVVNLMEPVVVTATDDWDIEEEWFDQIFAQDGEVDVYYVQMKFGADRVWKEFATRTTKQLIMPPNLWNPTKAASLYNIGIEPIVPFDWEEYQEYMYVLRAKKALRKANILLINRFHGDLAMAGATDSFVSLEEVTKKFGTHFRSMNIHEFMDCLEPLPEGGNITTPGRVTTPNLTQEEIDSLTPMAKELIDGAEEAQISEEYLIKSLKAWKLTNKLMEQNGCCGCAIPCPDICSTRRINEGQFTFCMNHSLNLEKGIPSACEYDIAATLTMLLEIAISGKAPYMANTLPVTVSKGGRVSWPQYVPKDIQEQFEAAGDCDNLYALQHSTVHRQFNGIDAEPTPYALRHFAFDQEFGAIFRHDFDANIGQTITCARLSGDCKRLHIMKGEVVKGYMYDSDNCNGGFLFRVNDIHKSYRDQVKAGMHMPLVFGDYVDELEKLAEVLGLEAVIS